MILIPISEVVYEITCLTESNQFTDTIATHSVIMPLCSSRGLLNCAAGHLNSYVGERTIASGVGEERFRRSRRIPIELEFWGKRCVIS